ncbi:MAG TPA: MarR family transcriptional regulator [Candidatus Saccharimonadales bacterium]|nr:MarR family transcriptional regulator [Candidatus Saccharimonadales bacterium]
MKQLSSIQQKFILHWGEMGLKWGINRTVAQIHALLYLSPAPLTAEAICEALGVARSNVSNSLRELQNWGIIKVVHIMGDRRDHFESMKDVWEMFRIVLAERKKREVDPTIEMLRNSVEELKKENGKDAYTMERLAQMKEFFETMGAWYNQVNQLSTPAVVKFVKMGEKIRKLIS